jgi:hypothetical protein
MGLKTVVPVGPHLPVAADPLRCQVKTIRAKRAWPRLGGPAARDQLRVLEHLDVLRYCGSPRNVEART